MAIITVSLKDGTKYYLKEESNPVIATRMINHLRANALKDGYTVSVVYVINTGDN